jgi:hypothetical protein
MKGRRTHTPLWAETSALRDEILRRHAVLGRGGQLSRCEVHPGRKRKVTFRTWRAAVRAEEELAQVGALRQSVHECGDHFHLTKLRGTAPEEGR